MFITIAIIVVVVIGASVRGYFLLKGGVSDEINITGLGRLNQVAKKYIKIHPDYTLYSFENSISICFNYKDIPANEICTLLYEEAHAMVGFGSFNSVEFIRLITINANNSEEDILHFFKVLEKGVKKIELESVLK